MLAGSTSSLRETTSWICSGVMRPFAPWKANHDEARVNGGAAGLEDHDVAFAPAR
jgi:hypothetical protein